MSKVWLAQNLNRDEPYVYGIFADETAAYSGAVADEFEAVSTQRGTVEELAETWNNMLSYLTENLWVQEHELRA